MDCLIRVLCIGGHALQMHLANVGHLLVTHDKQKTLQDLAPPGAQPMCFVAMQDMHFVEWQCMCLAEGQVASMCNMIGQPWRCVGIDCSIMFVL